MSHAEPFYHLSTGISIGLAGSKCPLLDPKSHTLKKKKKKKKKKKAYIISLCVERKKMVYKLQRFIQKKKAYIISLCVERKKMVYKLQRFIQKKKGRKYLKKKKKHI
jgi:hypothetical protein